jgi:hypothetical protein
MPKARIVDLTLPAALAPTAPESYRIREHSCLYRQSCSISERSDFSHVLSCLLRKGLLRNCECDTGHYALMFPAATGRRPKNIMAAPGFVSVGLVSMTPASSTSP